MVDDELYYCQIAYDAADAETAMDATADANDIETGCNGFGWSVLRYELAIAGSYTDNWGGSHTVDAFTWSSGDSSYHIDNFSNEDMWIVAQNDTGNTYNPDLWSKFEWTMADDMLYYCQIAYDAADAETAMDATADANDVETGCNGFGWSILTLAE